MPAVKVTNLMRKLAASLFPEQVTEQEAFLDALSRPADNLTAIAWTVTPRHGELPAIDRSDLPDWLPDFIEVLEPGFRPGKTDAFARGDIYPLDLSSVVTGSALFPLRDAANASTRVLDLCAAPGGKSILASLLLHPELLLANEVEGKRLGPLRHNLARCHIPNAFTQRLRPEEIAELAPESFSLCLVDAPCSGQSLLAKGQEHPGCFHPATIRGNTKRQVGILRQALKTVAPGGFLFYSTCTFSLRENEGAMGKVLRDQPAFEALEVPHLESLRSPHADFPCYRVYPHRGPGAGGFVCLLQRVGTPAPVPDLPREFLAYPVSADSKTADEP